MPSLRPVSYTHLIEVMSKFEKNKEVKDSDFGEEYDLGIKNGYNFCLLYTSGM